MGVVLETRDEKLTLGGIGGSYVVRNGTVEAVIQLKPGVLLFEDIPAGANVHARVSWDHNLLDDGRGGRAVGTLPAGILQPYAFELAPFPDPSAQLGLPAGQLRTMKRIIVGPGGGPGGSGRPAHYQSTPTFAPFAPVQDGILVQSGKAQHTLVMPGQPADTPELSVRDRNILRFRWVGTPVAAAVLAAVAADTALEDIQWVSAHRNLVPGSIRVTLPTSTLHLRDDGRGRMVTESGEAFAGDGVVDYQSGAFQMRFGVAETGNILVDYEHDCAYEGLDLHLSWDALMSQ